MDSRVKHGNDTFFSGLLFGQFLFVINNLEHIFLFPLT